MEDVISFLNEYRSFSILIHDNPDGDCIGSAVAMGLILRQYLGKPAFVFGLDGLPHRYEFLSESINSLSGGTQMGEAVCVLDTSDLERVRWGRFVPDAFGDFPSVNIDHHRSNSLFADINWVDDSASSVGEMIFNIIRTMGFEFTPEISTALYTALLTDTGRFTFTNTTSKSLAIASFLVEHGANPFFITEQIYRNFSPNYLRNMGIALFNVHFFIDGRVAYITLDRASVKNFSTSFDETEGIVDLALTVKGIQVAAFFKEFGPNNIRISLRSRNSIDVGALAEEFDGGGHKNAAGLTIKAPLNIAQQALLDRIKRFLYEQDKANE